MTKIAAVAIVAAIAGYALHAFAQPRADARMAVTALGTSSSNGISFAWFYDPADRTVYVCRAGQAAGDAVECRSKTTLP
jgi:anti-sigma-K factor RskA